MNMKNQRLRSADLAGIQYWGLAGITQSCIVAVTSLFNLRERIRHAALVTASGRHGFLIETEFEEIIAVKAGFTSGYPGEGPRGLAVALQLLSKHRVEIDEYLVDEAWLARLDASCLLQSDLDTIERTPPLRPQRWHDYLYDQRRVVDEDGTGLAHYYGFAVPFGLIDDRIMDLAVDFRDNPDAALFVGYRRLEDVFRERTGMAGEGTKLFAKAFLGDSPLLRWDLPDEGESKGRAQLFAAAYMAFRNARFHREFGNDTDAALREFLILNELYRLEAEAMTEFEINAARADAAEEKKALATLIGADRTTGD